MKSKKKINTTELEIIKAQELWAENVRNKLERNKDIRKKT